jgi:hypothetical protein
MSSTMEELAAARAACGSAAPTVRMSAYLRVPEPIGERWRARVPPGSESSVAGLKVHADGALGPRTAWLSRAYEDAPQTCGEGTAEDDRLRAVAQLADQRGLGLAVHAIGDAALHQALRTVGEPGDPRLRIEHASVTPPETWAELQRVRPVVVVQPGFRQTDRWLRERLGSERARWTYAYRTLHRLGIPLAGSSDAPVESLDPWAGMRLATIPRGAGPSGEELTASEALSLYTSGGGAALRDPSIGRLEPGSPADLVVLSSDSWETALSQGSRSVRSTYRAGEATFVRP